MVYIFTEGGEQFGWGHLSRCISLCDAFIDKGIKVHFFIDGDVTVKFIIEKYSYELLNWKQLKSDFFNEISDTDIVLIDSYSCSERQLKTISSNIKHLIILDDNGGRHYYNSIILNPTVFAKELTYPSKNKKILGPGFTLLRKPFWGVDYLGVNDQIKNIVISVSGDRSDIILQSVINNLNQAHLSNIHLYIISSEQLPKRGLVEFPITYYDSLDAKKVVELFLRADLVVCTAGQTMIEALSLGIPTLPVVVADNQKPYCDHLNKIAILNNVLDIEEKEFNRDFKNDFFEMFKKGKREKQHLLAKKILNKSGAKAAVDQILTFYNDGHV